MKQNKKKHPLHNNSDETLSNIVVSESSPEYSLTELKSKIKQLDQMVSRIDQRLNQYENKLAQLTAISQQEQTLIDLGLSLFNLSNNNPSNTTY
tara:strand:+ start:293 stop:574 length:282 start_codon:yes stop_codon:yes gene_type:complete